MAVSKYIRIGLRADKNLIDVPDKNAALGNILDDMIPNQSFLPGDLQVINGLNTTDVWAPDLAELTGLQVSYSPLSLDSAGNLLIGAPQDVLPRTRVIDQLRNNSIVLGTPGFDKGGLGPIAKVFPANALTSNSATLSHGTTITAEDIFDETTEGVVTTQEYWMDGRFGFSNAFYPTFSDGFGGISWTGFLSNHNRRAVRLMINSFILVEKFNKATDSFVTVKCASQESFSLTVAADNNGTTFIDLQEGDDKYVFNGMVVNGTHVVSDILGQDTATPSIELTSIDGAGNLNVLNGDTVNFEWSIADDEIRATFHTTDAMPEGSTQKVRITAWYPKPEDFVPAKPEGTIFAPFGMHWDMDYDTDIISDNSTPYNVFYAEEQGNPNLPAKDYTFEHFRRNVISTRNKRSEHYYLNESPLYVRYTPKFKVNEISKRNSSFNMTSFLLHWRGENTFVIDNASHASNVEIGDYLLFANTFAPTGNSNNHFVLQVFNISGDFLTVEPYKTLAGEEMSVIMNEYGYSVNDAIPFYAINPTGVVGIFTQKSASITIAGDGNFASTLYNVANSNFQSENNETTDFFSDDVLNGDLVVNLASGTAGDTTHPYRFDRITSISRSNPSYLQITSQPAEVITDVAQGISARKRTQFTYSIVYAHRGLIDNSTAAQCINIFGHEVARETESSPGVAGASTTIKLLSVENVVQGLEVQFEGVDPDNPVIPYGTAVDSVNPNPADGIPEIVLTDPVNLPASVTLVFVPSGTGSLNKELCVMPLNTAPPFQGTDFGLETTGQFPHLVVGGDFSITGVKFNSATSTEITPTTDDADGGLLLKTPSGEKYWALFDTLP